MATAFMVLVSGATAAQKLPISRASGAAQMARDFRTLSPEEMMRHYFPCEGGDDVGEKLVEAGSSTAISIAVKLHGKTGAACGNEEITSAVSNAILTNAEAVLRYAKPALFNGDSLCAPAIYDDASDRKAISLLWRAKRALERVRDPSLLAARDKCLAEYPRYFANIRNFPKQ